MPLQIQTGTIMLGDIREIAKTLPTGSVNCIVTSPPYFGLRDYGVAGQIGLEPTPEEYVAGMVGIFRELRRVLLDDGTLWLNLGDSYANDNKWGGSTGGKHAKGLHGGNGLGREKSTTNLLPKNLVGIPWRVAFALQADGWNLRSDIIWSKPNPMPESVTDRPTKAHEYIFLLAKSKRYYYDADAIKEPQSPDSLPRLMRGVSDGDNGYRNKRSVWEITLKPYSGAHFATFPPELIRPCILAGCPAGGVVLDPFFGSGTTGEVCIETGRQWLGVELNPQYIKLAENRIAGAGYQPELFCLPGEQPINGQPVNLTMELNETYTVEG